MPGYAYEVSTQPPTVTDNSLDEARSLMGVELNREGHQWNEVANHDAIRHFAYSIGDDNPLFCNKEYGMRRFLLIRRENNVRGFYSLQKV